MGQSKDPRETNSQANEGEGNKTAARNFNREQREFAKSGQVDKKAKEAEQAISGKEGAALRQAEHEGESKARH